MGSLLGGPRSADLDEAERVEHERELAAAWRTGRPSWRSFRNMVDRRSAIASDLVPAKPTGKRPGASGLRERTARAKERARTLADDARIKAFDLLGERRRALAILERRLGGQGGAA